MSVVLRGIRKSYPDSSGALVPVLNLIDLLIGSAERIALTGPSGAGKSTLLHLIAGTVLPDAGTVLHDWAGASCSMSTSREAVRDQYRGRHLGCVFQGNHLLAALSARENVLLGLTVTGRPSDPAWATELLTAVGLGQRLDHKPAQLSPGQRLRVACARALVGRPALLLIDEPTASLDALSATQVLELLLGLAAELHAAVVVITHDPAVAARVGRDVPLHSINRCVPC